MKISNRGRYGTIALLYLARHKGDRPVLLKDIARRQQIPLRYLEHLITPLITGNVIQSTRGPRGGVSLAKAANDIKLSEVIQLLEGSVAPVECINNPGTCSRSDFCAPRDVWGELKRVIDGFLESMTLQDLVERQNRKELRESQMYHI